MSKVIKSLVMASAILLLGSNVYAVPSPYGDYNHYSSTAAINTIIVDTKDEAYSIGFQTLKALKAKTSNELNDEFGLRLRTNKEKNSIAIEDGSYITVQEFMNERGKVVFKGVVNVNYHYSMERNN
jgi:hypothetical protein